jgi:nucleotide-binding universal stress UspA family protein
MAGPILIAYDGSDDARAAVRSAAELFAGREAFVVTVWESAAGLAGGARAALPAAVVQEAMAALDDAAREEAEAIAAEGAELARGSGAEAKPLAAKASHNVWSTLIGEAERHDAAVLVVGSRGRSPVKAALLGSVSSAATAQSKRPVLVVREASG